MIFRNLGKMRFFKFHKKSVVRKIEMFDVFFKMAKPVCRRLHFNLIKHFTQKTFIFKNVGFSISNQKMKKYKKTFPKHH